MRSWVRSIGFLFVAALFAGCSQAPASEPADEVTAEPAQEFPMARQSFHAQGTTGTEVATYYVGGQQSANFTLQFPVEQGATGLVYELVWSDPNQDMEPGMGAPKQCLDLVPFPDSAVVCMVDIATESGEYCYWTGPVGPGDSPARLMVTGPAEVERCGFGDWYVWASTRSANDQLPFDLHVTVFYDGTDPASVSAIP